MLNRLKTLIAILLLAFATAGTANADITVKAGYSDTGWNGYMNVFELPANGGGFVFGQPWGIADLTANFDDVNSTLTLGAAPINTGDAFWYQNGSGGAGAAGNKNMEANLYYQFTNDPLYSGQTVTFTGNVLANNWNNGRTTRAFIRDFAPDFSSSTDQFLNLTGPGAFSFSLATDAGAGRHIQVGFQSLGPNVWPGDEAAEGNFVLGTIPEPSSATVLLGIGILTTLRHRRRK